jgi:hypothetical protein
MTVARPGHGEVTAARAGSIDQIVQIYMYHTDCKCTMNEKIPGSEFHVVTLIKFFNGLLIINFTKPTKLAIFKYVCLESADLKQFSVLKLIKYN